MFFEERRNYFFRIGFECVWFLRSFGFFSGNLRNFFSTLDYKTFSISFFNLSGILEFREEPLETKKTPNP